MDPWLINPMHAHCGQVDFAASDGARLRARANVEALLTKIRRQVQGIRHQRESRSSSVKADNGTYGMGIMTVRDIEGPR